jgi:hypothetical protein
MNNKCMNKCSKSLAIKYMQTKMALRFHLTPVRIAVIKKIKVLSRMQGKVKPNSLLVGMKISASTMEINMEVHQKPKNRSTL